jgi:hypothetical protein
MVWCSGTWGIFTITKTYLINWDYIIILTNAYVGVHSNYTVLQRHFRLLSFSRGYLIRKLENTKTWTPLQHAHQPSAQRVKLPTGMQVHAVESRCGISCRCSLESYNFILPASSNPTYLFLLSFLPATVSARKICRFQTHKHTRGRAHTHVHAPINELDWKHRWERVHR